MKTNLIHLAAACAAALWLSPAVHAAESPPNLAAVRAKTSQNGPFRTDPAQGTPKHAYSPFDKLNQPPPYQPAVGRDFLPGKLVVKLKPASPASSKLTSAVSDIPALQQKFAKYGVTSVERVFPNAQPPGQRLVVAGTATTTPPPPDLTRWLQARCGEDQDVQALAKQLASDPDVDIAEPDYIRRLAGYIPHGEADPLFTNQWHLAAAKVPEAWAYLDSQGLSPGGNHDIVVAVIDTGVDYNHPDLAANMWVNSREIPGNGIDDDGNGFVDDVHGCSVVSNSGSHTGNPMDDHGHGTHVAGIIGAQAGNSNGVVGVAYNCQIMAIKAAQYSGVLAASDIAEAINYAVQQGADVINMSFGGYAKSQVEQDALAVAFGQCVLVAAAGNDGLLNERACSGKPMYPAAYNWVLGVMASKPVPDENGWLASFSNSDCIPHNTIEYELMAPGVDVWSTLPNNQYAAWDGTSMAAPIVSGMAVLARTKFSDKDVYSSRFIMGQIAGRQEPMQNVADAYSSLTTSPVPELRYLQHWLFDTTNQAAANDNDGIIDAGETVELGILIRNQWGKADNVEATLEAWAQGAFQPDPYVTVGISNVQYGAVGAFNQDDNGLLTDSGGGVVGARYPFRFSLSTNCPNDHVVPMRLTLTCRNGMDSSDPTVYTTTSRFSFIVQHGRALPSVIANDMTLTADYFWLVPEPTLISEGVTVRIRPGAQLSFGAPASSGVYENTSGYAWLQVQGSLFVEGTASAPVELFPTSVRPSMAIDIRGGPGTVSLRYAKAFNPYFGGAGPGLTEVDHCLFVPEGGGPVDYYTGRWGWAERSPTITVPVLSKSVVRGFVSDWLVGINRFTECLIEHSRLVDNEQPPTPVERTVFLPLAGTRGWPFHGNAVLNNWHILDRSAWMTFPGGTEVSSNYWGTTSELLIDAAIDDVLWSTEVTYRPILTNAPVDCFPFVVDIAIATEGQPAASGLNGATPVVGPEPVTFNVTFNRDMATNQPQVSFGPDAPVTDYMIHPVNGGWQDARTWVGTFNITPTTGDGYQLIRVAGAVAADDPWLVTGDDAGRFRFEIITSGTESMNLQATGGEGRVDLSWMQDDFDLLAGYNLYRSTNPSNNFTRLNSAIIPSQTKSWMDTSVLPGQPYFYRFTVVKSDMGESDFSNVAEGTPLDTIPPVLTHTPLTSAAPGMPLTLTADATDNVAVQGVTLYFGTIGATNYTSRAMTRTTDNPYAATIEGSRLVSPGVEYYLEATDGISTVRSGRPEYPWQVVVVDRPVVNVVTPNRGPASGGTFVTIAGSNFKTNATVSFGGVPASSVTVVSANQITCTTAAHFPAAVDVLVTNPDTQSGTLLLGYTYRSEVASLSLPNTGGPRYGIVQVPINAANVQGLAAASLTVTFDPTVLRGVTAHSGSLTPGWYLVPATNTAGQIRLSMASPGSTSTSSGVLAYVDFEVLGSPGATCPLALTSVSLNDGAIQTQTASGSFAVNIGNDISGTVSFWNGSAVVPGVLCTLEGDRVYTGTSASNGLFTVAGAEAGSYTLTPSKSDNTGGISAYDASLVLQHDAGLITLGGGAATAADVNKSGQITAFDAFYILQKAVDLIALPFPGAGQVWMFDPTNRSYSGLSSSQTGQSFIAVLLGDVSGNWMPPGSSPPPPPGGSGVGEDDPPPLPVTLALRSVSTRSNGTQVWLLVRAQDSAIYSLDLTLTNNASQGLAGLRSGAFTETMAMASNTNSNGQVRVAMAGAVPVQGVGAVLVMTLPAGQSNGVALISASINEGGVPVEIDAIGASFDQDTDGDGQTDWSEIRAGTSPTDKGSYFALRSVTIESGGGRRISWSAVPDKTYQVLFLEEDIGGKWRPLGQPVTAINNEASLLDDAATTAAGRLYRVQLVE
jgi:hypothetical protein